ncbi:hypothetical protein D0Z07_0738 [Hyphodiscus hymeniophilus]|uniref:Uncharacterized protein n=1 Tax=Hyphodiscus hymeniophilus TaxID=353542 RepID=A0A9P6VR63_9HELO|nr:hypothetical protein D0Z07_0738 [Hyphodiscus hymeniophilus]
MANHELPAWEAPSADSTPRNSFWRRLTQPFNTKNPFLTISEPSVDHKPTFAGTQNPFTRTQNFDKESGVSEPAAATSTTANELKSRGTQRRILGRSRRSVIICAVAAVLLLALIIGLAVGLSRHKYVNLNTFINHSPI